MVLAKIGLLEKGDEGLPDQGDADDVVEAVQKRIIALGAEDDGRDEGTT